MAQARFTDVRVLEGVTLPYDKSQRDLSDQPHLTTGQNLYNARDRTLRKRGGTGANSTDIADFEATGRIDRLVFYQTIESPPKVYAVASVYNGTDWSAQYLRLDAVTPVWTSMGTLRDLNTSERPHEFVIANGFLYIKAFPKAASGEKLGTVIFDGTGATTHFWGLEGPTQPARRTSPAGWPTSTNPVTVKNSEGWTYVYTWLTDLRDHESARSPIEFDPGQNPSFTGAFTNQQPQITLRGHPDTTRVPAVRVYRSSDGGGAYLFLEDVANPGDMNFTYTDDSLTGSDPVPDAKLDPNDRAPGATSNLPPPGVEDPLVVGTDQPRPSTPIVEWQGRLWWAVGKTVFFTAQEELRKGDPAQSYMGGIFGNFFEFRETVVQLIPTNNSLIVQMLGRAVPIVGQFQDTFRPLDPIAIGGAHGHPRAYTSMDNLRWWLTADFRIAQFNSQTGQLDTTFSEPLGTDVKDFLDSAGDGEIEFTTLREAPNRDWLVVIVHDKSDPSSSRWWVYDVVMGVWNTPWNGIDSVAATFGTFRESDRTPRLITAVNDGGVSGGKSRLVMYTDGIFTDYVVGSTPIGYAFDGETSLFPIPTGNQVNRVMVPDLEANVGDLILEWRSGVTSPTVEVARDNSTGGLSAVTGHDPTRRQPSVGYVTNIYSVEGLAQRARIKVSRSVDTEGFVLETLGFVWEPRVGM